MNQSKLESHIEATLNIASGFVISWCVWMYIVPLFWPHLAAPAETGFWITSLFTVTSYIRSYSWRRFFATGLHTAVHQFVLNLRKYT